LLSGYNEPQILAVGSHGERLYQFKKDYYEFQSKAVSWEENLLPHIGQLVSVRFPQAWAIYLKYIILRADGQSKDSIIAHGDFLNDDMTWDDAERVFTELSKDASFVVITKEIFALQGKMASEAREAASDIYPHLLRQ
jgi:hypothetical protein